MKEITRRLYTKPVMLGMAFLVGIALVVGFTAKSRAAATFTFIQAGDDKFETTDNGETYHNFQASPIPAGFFGPNSNAYSGVVPLVGEPLAPGTGDDTDTIIHRNQDVVTPGSTTITMTALNLKSISAITVTYSDGTPSQQWDVKVNLSGSKTSGGTMTFSSGGTFDSSLQVWPKFTFTRNGVTKVLDTGSGGSGLAAISDGSGSDSLQAASVSNGFEFTPAPEPIATVAPCRAVAVNDFESGATTFAAASSSCAPVTLTSTNNPWPITRPLTEQELLASHNASPPGTKKALATKAVVADR